MGEIRQLFLDTNAIAFRAPQVRLNYDTAPADSRLSNIAVPI